MDDLEVSLLDRPQEPLMARLHLFFFWLFFDLDQDVCCLHQRPLKRGDSMESGVEETRESKGQDWARVPLHRVNDLPILLDPRPLSLEELIASLVSDRLTVISDS